MILWVGILVPMVAAAVAGRAPRHARAIAGVGLASTAALGAWAGVTEATSALSWGPRLELTVAATGFARVMVVVVPVVALPIVLYAAVTETTGATRLVAALTAFVGAMELLVVATDLLTLLIGWELVGAFSWILIAHGWRDPATGRQASHAFITTRFADLGLYLAAGLLFAATGSFAFGAIDAAGTAHAHVIAAGVLLAAAAKSAQIPFSPWLFSAMAGPTPVSALLHSSTMVAAGAYLLIRLAPHLASVAWFSPALIAIGLVGALAGGVVAAVHRHPKRLLAASTTAQYGLMFVAIGAGSLVAAAAHLVMHAAFKSLLFLTSGAAMHAAGSEDLGAMRVGRLRLVTASAAVGALALAGVPPLGGAWSKEQITGAAFEYGPALGAAIVGASFLGAFYAFRYVVLAFGPERRRGSDGPGGRLSIGLLAWSSIALGVAWISPVNETVAELLSSRVLPADLWVLGLGLGSAGAAALAVAALQGRGRLAEGVLPPVATAAASSWFGLAALARQAVVEPVLALSRVLAAIDDHVIDAGVRASARIAAGVASLLRRRSEISIDAVVDGVARMTLVTASGTRTADDLGVDRAAEGIAAVLGRAGYRLRSLQTGLSHHYYVIVAIGLIAIATALSIGTS